VAKSTVKFQPTPNPNALKCEVEAPIPPLKGRSGPRSYAKAADVSGDPLAQAILSIEGVVNVLISDKWLTVNREPQAEWKPIKSAIQTVLRKFGEPASDAVSEGSKDA
jgi:hypothetical protein